MTTFAMTTDNAVEDKNFEPNSLREVLLFCAVLVVEVYSLAVAIGGPFFEVGYFLLVIISQTTAGACIWAQLRRTDISLPLPELLAMGFAIGSASAAISQLIIRDLLGIRLFISPLVPIIGVAIWLITRRNTRLPVTISHATTSTLLWLLFPAPLAISFLIWQLHMFFIIPLGLFAFFTKYLKAKTFGWIIIMIGSLSAIFGFLFNTMQKTPIALSLFGWDELFDEAMAIGFANWGIDDHIGRAGDSVAYYKLSHLWLGPLLEMSNSTPIIITTSIVPLAIFTFIGLALWSLSFEIYRSDSAAGIGTILVFLQCALPEPENFAIRIAQSLVIVYSLSALNALIKSSTNQITEILIVLFSFFVIFGTRAQYGLILLFGYSIHKLALMFRHKVLRTQFILLLSAAALSLISSFLIFFNDPPHGTGSPNQGSAILLMGFFVSVVGLRSLIPLMTLTKINGNRVELFLSMILASAIIFFVIPQSFLSNAPSLIITLLTSILIAYDTSKLRESITTLLFVSILILASSLGFLLRLFYDLYKWTDRTNIRGFFKLLVALATDGKYIAFFAMVPFVALIVLLHILMKVARRQFNWRPIMLLTALSMSLGISIATIYRSVTAYFKYGIELSSDLVPESPMSWYVESNRLDALEWMRDNTQRDEIFAQNNNTPDFRISAYNSSLILSASIHRRAFVEGIQSTELQQDFPRHVSHQSERQRKELLRLNISYIFPIAPNETRLKILQSYKVKWFVVDLGNTELRDWEPYATTRFMNEKVAILELALLPAPSD